MSQLPDPIITAMARRFADKSAQIALELCKAVGRGSPTHPRLTADIKDAAFCALYSETFRALVVAIEAGTIVRTLDGHGRSEMVALRPISIRNERYESLSGYFADEDGRVFHLVSYDGSSELRSLNEPTQILP